MRNNSHKVLIIVQVSSCFNKLSTLFQNSGAGVHLGQVWVSFVFYKSIIGNFGSLEKGRLVYFEIWDECFSIFGQVWIVLGFRENLVMYWQVHIDFSCRWPGSYFRLLMLRRKLHERTVVETQKKLAPRQLYWLSWSASNSIYSFISIFSNL